LIQGQDACLPFFRLVQPVHFPAPRLVKLVIVLLVLVVAIWQSDTVAYVGTVAIEHVRLMAARRPIRKLIAASDTPPELRRRLEYILHARKFASQSLGLPDNGSFTTYVEIGRRSVAWAVSAAPEFSTAPITWCFPFAGCVSYRGYPSRSRAEAFAASLRASGDDVTISATTAYSTLGWFDDPVLSSYINRPPAELAALIFHELAHQVLYVKGDSAFNEGFATTVEREGARRWLIAEGDIAALAHQEEAERQEDFEARILIAAQAQLAGLYQSALSRDHMREEKRAVLQHTRELLCGADLTCTNTALLRSAAGGISDLNNASLVAIATYYAYVPAFRELLRRSDFNLSAFFAAAHRAGSLPPQQRQDFLRSLTTTSEPRRGIHRSDAAWQEGTTCRRSIFPAPLESSCPTAL